ncbi:MAG: DUF4430 domain-containing protein [Oscillospiraceae bacterium]|nr:DUF4430 domain-containing protein [Oscillospiraceae bacterium]
MMNQDKRKKRIANIAMSMVIVLIILSGVLAVGGQQGWFDKKDPAETGVVRAVVGTADLTRDGIASPLSADTALRDGDVLTTQEHAELTLQAGDSTMKLGAGSSLTVTHAAADSFTVQITTGQFFTAAGETASVTLEFGDEDCTLSSAAADLTVRTGSETLYLLSGTLTLDGTDYEAGQALSWVDGALTADSFSPTVLDDEVLGWCLNAGQALCFTSDELRQVLDTRVAQQQSDIEAQLNGGAAQADGSASENAETTQSGETDTKSDGTGHVGQAPADSGTANAADPAPSSPTDSEPSAPAQPDTPAQPEPEPEEKSTCTISVRCDTILNNMDSLDPDKAGYVPSSGILLSKTTVTISDGDSAYDVLKRACSAAGLQLEASYTAAYGSYYVEGIGHLYEFDCGPESGWLYKVNGWFPNYGCSSYTVSDGDNIVFCYTCNGLGADVGA